MPNQNTTDFELCERLWYECEPTLRKICSFKLSSHPDEIDDVISCAYLALCNAVCMNKIPDKPKAWLFGAMNNIIKEKYREISKQKKLLESLSSDENLYQLTLDFEFSFEKTDDEEIDRIKDEIFSELSENERQLLSWIYDDKLKMKEIAVLTSSNEFAVKQRHYRLCKKIQKKVKAKLGDV